MFDIIYLINKEVVCRDSKCSKTTLPLFHVLFKKYRQKSLQILCVRVHVNFPPHLSTVDKAPVLYIFNINIEKGIYSEYINILICVRVVGLSHFPPSI